MWLRKVRPFSFLLDIMIRQNSLTGLFARFVVVVFVVFYYYGNIKRKALYIQKSGQIKNMGVQGNLTLPIFTGKT